MDSTWEVAAIFRISFHYAASKNWSCVQLLMGHVIETELWERGGEDGLHLGGGGHLSCLVSLRRFQKLGMRLTFDLSHT